MMDTEKFTDREKKEIQNCFDTKIKNVISGMVVRKNGNTCGVTLDFDSDFKTLKIQTNHDADIINGVAPDKEMHKVAESILEKVKDIFNENNIVYKDARCEGAYGNPIILDFSF